MSAKPNRPGGASPKTPPPAPRPSLESIVASAPVRVFLLNLDGRYQYASRRVRNGSAEDEAGMLLEQVHAPEQAAELRALMRRVASSGRPRSVEVASVDGFGRPCRCLLMLAPFLVDGRVDGFIGVGLATSSEEATADRRAAELAARLTPKQREVLVLVAEGLSSREIGRRLGVSERTVETHREQLMDRLDIRGVAALARFALSAGLL